jgi:histidinol dehydrogenase
VTTFAVVGAVDALEAPARAVLLDRATSDDPAIRAHTAAILARVRAEGDVALRAYAREFDGCALERLEVPRTAWDEALAGLAAPLRAAMERAARNIAAVHRAFAPSAVETTVEPGIVVGRRPDPLTRVGVYAPGGRAAYPSSLLMGAIPARVAGVGEVVVCSPPGRDGRPSAVVLAAAALAGVDRVFAIGGAGAVGAMAYGTASVPRCDRIVGPGNAYVAEAKVQVSSVCGIDSPAGPSELLVIADGSVDAAVIAREVVAQAEHDPRASVVVVALSSRVADAIAAATASALDGTARRAIAAEALATRGGLLVARSPDEATGFAAAYAAEHLLLAVADPAALLPAIRCAGTVFLGATSSVAFGDYLTGANHVLPTGGLARSYSGLSTLDFVRWTTYQRVDRVAARALAADVDTFATAEGLPAHAAAARQWGAA